MEKNKDILDERIISHLYSHPFEFDSAFIIFSDRLKGKGDTHPAYACSHQIMTKKGKKRSCFVEYEPTPDEWNRIKSHQNFSGVDKIDFITICTVCGVITVYNK